jgi:hypothetical protein
MNASQASPEPQQSEPGTEVVVDYRTHDFGKPVVDYGQVIDIMAGALHQLADHLESHKMVADWDKSVAEIHAVLGEVDALEMSPLWETYPPAVFENGRFIGGASKEQVDAAFADENRRWSEFWDSIRDNMRKWWD